MFLIINLKIEKYHHIFLKMLSAITITLSESVSHGNDMWRIGLKAKIGFSNDELIRIFYSLPQGFCELINLKDILPKTLYDISDAYILVIRNMYNNYADKIFNTMINIESNDENGNITGVKWDNQRFNKNKIVENKLHSKLLFLDIGSEYKVPFNLFEKRGTIYNVRRIPELFQFTTEISSLLMTNFYIEGTNYYNTNECYSPLSQNKESKQVVNLHLGSSIKLNFKWFHNTTEVSDLKSIQLNHGDVYFMNELALGSVKESKTKLFLKHGITVNN